MLLIAATTLPACTARSQSHGTTWRTDFSRSARTRPQEVLQSCRVQAVTERAWLYFPLLTDQKRCASKNSCTIPTEYNTVVRGQERETAHGVRQSVSAEAFNGTKWCNEVIQTHVSRKTDGYPAGNICSLHLCVLRPVTPVVLLTVSKLPAHADDIKIETRLYEVSLAATTSCRMQL